MEGLVQLVHVLRAPGDVSVLPSPQSCLLIVCSSSDRVWRRDRPEPPECCLATASDCTTSHATQSHGDRRFALLYAESTDGITWVKPNLNLVEFEGSTENNIVGGVNGTTGTSVSRTTS